MFPNWRRSFVAGLLRSCRYKLRKSRWSLLAKTRRTVTIPTRQGLLTVACADQVIGSRLYCDREFELDLMLRAFAHLRQTGKMPPKGKGTILDIGANMGVISVGMLYLGELERGIAIEPDPTNFALLEKNIAQNGFAGRMVCLQGAASDQAGEVPFEMSESNYGDHRVRIRAGESDNSGADLYGEDKRQVVCVRAARLDDLLSQVYEDWTDEIKLIWIDTQGHEGHVFRGGENLFARGIPVVAEIWPYGLERAGTSPEDFCRVAARFWSHYWVWRRAKFVRYPIETLDIFMDELGTVGDHDNVIFTR